ncbi:hypothetical protein BGX28_007833 [Mortierella sp. GBA30]|nr:hypothetical protein BGX28_007833 [Mortierella sp. GBA30]
MSDLTASSAGQLASILRFHLMKRLPEYMIPAAFVGMDAFPLTPNGKLDRRALPPPGNSDLAQQAYEAPQGEIESVLASIWMDLLHVEKVSRHDSFFALGGHSLLAVQMIARLHHLGHSISVRTLFESPTLSVLAQSVGEQCDIVVAPPNLITQDATRITPDMLPLIRLHQMEIDRIIERVPGGKANIQDIYALSPLQDGILFHYLMAETGDPYILFVYILFDTRTLLDQYLVSMVKVMSRHDILRTSFVWENISTPAQVVWRAVSLSITELQLDSAAGPVKEQLERMFNHGNSRMDLAQAPLLRCVIAQESDGRWILLKIIHHLISDHATSRTVESEIQALCRGKEHTLPPAQPYRNLIAQVHLRIGVEEHERFFKQMLVEVDTPSLPFGITIVHGEGTRFTESRRMLPQDLNNRLRSQARRLRVNLASLCHVAWAQVVARTSAQKNAVFGTVLVGRMHAFTNLDRATGPFINTLPIRVDTDRGKVEENVRSTNARLAALFEHEWASLALAQRCSSVAAGVPLFSSLLNYIHNNSPLNSDAEYGMRYLESQLCTSYPFALSVEDCGTSLGLKALVVQPFDPARVCGYMQEALSSLAGALHHNPGICVSKLEVLPKEERQMLLSEWNATKDDYHYHIYLHHQFEQQVERTPDAIAVVYGDQSLTYTELNIGANRLAHQLIKLGVQPDTLVSICVERSPKVIIGILAILKAGGAYVPLDPFYASERLTEILRDAAPSILVADSTGRNALGNIALSSIIVVDPDTMDHTVINSNPIIQGLTSRCLAYVIHTSGSSGKPKGVLVEHEGVANFVRCMQALLEVDASSHCTQFLSISFDASANEMFSTLCFGGCLHLLQDAVRLDREQMWNYVQQHSVTHTVLTPTLLQDCQDMPALRALRTITVTGEAIPPSLPELLRKIAPNSTIINGYGPTECCIGTTLWKFPPGFCGDIIPIGHPISHKTIYLLDDHGNPVPLGAVGEIFIGGVGLARGYLNRPKLTAERFLHDPFAGQSEAQMYKTGDLARYLPDGNLVYMGRNDDQVKIRGFRIELGEIEARLVENPLVSEAVVIAPEEGSDKHLVAYIIVQQQSMEKTESHGTARLALTLRSYLAKRLPEYMVPAAFVRMDAFPLTPNGKLDRKALPAPEDSDFAL